MALAIKKPSANAGDMRSWFDLHGKGHLEEGIATHSSILAWRIPRTEEPSQL